MSRRRWKKKKKKKNDGVWMQFLSVSVVLPAGVPATFSLQVLMGVYHLITLSLSQTQ